jgi:L-ascorbate metabolism protein UlaG (beta-lactamase superfamily)
MRRGRGGISLIAGMTACLGRALRDLYKSSAAAALKCFLFLLLALTFATPGWAACTGAIADGGARVWRAAAQPEKAVAVTFLGHASFLIESPQGVRIVTDYNDLVRAPVTPDIVTMNNAHTTHWTDAIEPGVKHVLRGWDPGGRMANHKLEFRDVRVHNVPTNVRNFGTTRYNGNSIFVFDLADLCIAHLGHLHHTLTEAHLAELGPIDVVMVPVDGSFTLNTEEMVQVLTQLKAKIALPMHIFSDATLARFLARAADRFEIRRLSEPKILVSRADLPEKPEIQVLPGR